MSSEAKDARWTYALKIAEALHLEWDDMEYNTRDIYLQIGQILYELHGTLSVIEHSSTPTEPTDKVQLEAK